MEIIQKDSQSNPNRAAEVATELIEKDQVKMLLTKGTPDTVNPVSDQAELNGIPCISDDAPWQTFFFGRGGDPTKGFKYTYHCFWGLEDVIANFIDMWDKSGAAKVVGGVFANDADGNAWGRPQGGLSLVLWKRLAINWLIRAAISRSPMTSRRRLRPSSKPAAKS